MDLIFVDSVFYLEFDPDSGFLKIKFFTTRNRNYALRKKMSELKYVFEYSITDDT